MICFLKGAIAGRSRDQVYLDVHGVGYAVYLPQGHLKRLGAEGDHIFLHTALIVREDSMTLYGFFSEQERELFNMMLAVSGVGAKTALAILSTFELPDLVGMIIGGAAKQLAKAPGIGEKTAQRLIIELKTKLAKWEGLSASHQLKEESGADPEALEEAEFALMALGYEDHEINDAFRQILPKLAPTASSEDMIREALRWLSE